MRRMLRFAASLSAVAGLLVAPSPGAPAQSVTMSFTRFYDNACRCYKARVSGQVSSGRAGEYVVVLRQYCGLSFGTSVAGATTRDGGFWETELPVVSRPDALVSETYRARWNGNLSAPVRFRGRLSVTGFRLQDGRQRVTVKTPDVNPVKLTGRAIVVQRQQGASWAKVASARLAAHPKVYYTFIANAPVQRRGRLRAVVPAASAAPCFVTSVSKPWTS